MKWFKHMSDSHNDSFLQEVMDRFGHTGYAAWFMLMEIIADDNGDTLTGYTEIEPKTLKRKMRISVKKLGEIFRFFLENDKLLFENSGQKWKFYHPNMLKLKDKHTKTGPNPAHNWPTDQEGEGDADKKHERARAKESLSLEDQVAGAWNRVLGKSNGEIGTPLSDDVRLLVRKTMFDRGLNDPFWWEGLFQRINSEMPFLLGKNRDGWKMTFIWLFQKPTNFSKVFNGDYKVNPPAPCAGIVGDVPDFDGAAMQKNQTAEA